MKTVLQVSASMFGEAGQSSQLAVALARVLLQPGDRLIERDLGANPVPHLTAQRFAAFSTPWAERTAEQREVVAYSDQLIGELRAADVIVLGLPMYNFGIPSTLKAYFDHVARAGETFRYTNTGPEGLLTGKKAYVLAARGGHYQGTAADTETPYLRQFLGFLGIRDVEFIYAEGLAIGAEHKVKALDAANANIARLAA